MISFNKRSAFPWQISTRCGSLIGADSMNFVAFVLIQKG
jgi:hypothetical protein